MCWGDRNIFPATWLRLRRRCCSCLVTAALALSAVLTGCSIHYSNFKTGTESLLGLGGLRFQTNQVSQNLQSVVVGSVLPGLCIGIGPDHFGISLGYVKREQAFVLAATNNSARLRQNRMALPLSDDKSAPGLGYIRLTVPARAGHHKSIITGRALAGISLQAGADTSARAGMQTQQTTMVTDEDVGLTLESTNAVWPYFDYFNHLSITPLRGMSTDQTKTNQGED